MGGFPSAGGDHLRSLSSLAEKAGAGVLPGSRRFSLLGRLPLPRQQRFELMPFGPPGDNSFKHIGQPGQRFDAVQFCRLCRPPNYAERFWNDAWLSRCCWAVAWPLAPYHSA
jgi:hypothetical protein